jgi:replication factor C small subunit
MVKTLGQALLLEKYRPRTLDEVRGHDLYVERIKRFVENQNVPHCIFAGPQGIGKTTLALALARQMFGDLWQINFKELNASDARGIDVVRTDIKNFAEANPVDASKFEFKILFLDESDELTKDAQAALRRTMEKYSKTCRFILGCNWPNKLIDPIQSRCAVFRFTKLKKEDILLIIEDVVKGEGLKVDKRIREHIAEASRGDARIAINTLQEIAYMDKVTIEAVRKIIHTIDHALVEKCLKAALEGDAKIANTHIDNLIYNYGYSGEEILEAMSALLDEWGLDKATYGRLMYKMGEVDHRVHEGRSERIQLRCLIGYMSLLEYVSTVCPKLDIEE